MLIQSSGLQPSQERDKACSVTKPSQKVFHQTENASKSPWKRVETVLIKPRNLVKPSHNLVEWPHPAQKLFAATLSNRLRFGDAFWDALIRFKLTRLCNRVYVNEPLARDLRHSIRMQTFALVTHFQLALAKRKANYVFYMCFGPLAHHVNAQSATCIAGYDGFHTPVEIIDILSNLEF